MRRLFLSVTFFAYLFIAPLAWGSHTKSGGLDWHGYGELHYNRPHDEPDVVDFHRMALGLDYRMSRRGSLHTAVDFDHAAEEIELAFSYLDFDISPRLILRTGLMLMPVGPFNEHHEPTLFYSVERPHLQEKVIPVLWNEGGIGLLGDTSFGMQYRFYVVSGLNASGFSASNGIRGGRSRVTGGKGGAPITGDDFAVVGRMEYGISGFRTGWSGYHGGAGQGVASNTNVEVTILEGDIRYRLKGFNLSAIYAQVAIGNAEVLSAKKVGEKMSGWSGEVAYDFRAIMPRIVHKMLLQHMVLFIRKEGLNTQDAMPVGVSADPKHDLKITTYGLAFYPISDVAFKVDWENMENGAGSNTETLNAGVAYLF